VRFVGTAFVKNSVFRNNNLLYSGYTKGAGIDMHSGFLVVMGSTFTNNYGTAGQKSTSCLKLSDSAACYVYGANPTYFASPVFDVSLIQSMYLAGGAINVLYNPSWTSRVIVNTTDFTGNRGTTSGGGAIYFGSTTSGSSLNLEGVYFYNNTGIGGAPNDVYADLAGITCLTEEGSSTVVSGSTSGSCIADTQAPTPSPTTQPTEVRKQRTSGNMPEGTPLLIHQTLLLMCL
jgi:hypothetical protein